MFEERMEEKDLLEYAGKFDGTICGDDRYTRRVLEKCAPRLKVVSKWGTGIDSIDQVACQDLGNTGEEYPERIHLTGCRYGDGVYPGICPSPAMDGSGDEGGEMAETPRTVTIGMYTWRDRRGQYWQSDHPPGTRFWHDYLG